MRISLGQLKRMVRGPCSPLSQVIRRLSEQEKVIYNLDKEASPKVDKEHTDGPVPKCLSEQACRFKVLTFGDAVFKTKERDSCVKAESNLVLVQNIAQDNGIWYIVGYDYIEVAHFFTYPIDSKELGIYMISGLSTTLKFFAVGENLQKYVMLPFHNKFVAAPLHH